MATTITTISIPNDMALFCSEKGIKLSKITQDAIQNIMEADKVNSKFVLEQTRKIEALQGTINKQRDFIESKGLMEQFLGIC